MIDAKPKLVSAADIQDLEAQAQGQWPQPMTREYVSAHDVVQRYVNNELDDAELDAFEMLFLNDQDLLDEIDTEVAMKNGIAMAASRLEPSPVANATTGWLAWLSRPVVAIASLAALMLTTTVALYLQSQLTALRTGAPFSVEHIGPEVWLEKARSNNTPQQLPTVPTGRLSVLKIEIPPRSGEVVIVIENPDGSTRTLSPTRADSDNATSVLINPTAAGDFTVAVNSVGDGRQLVQYKFSAIEN